MAITARVEELPHATIPLGPSLVLATQDILAMERLAMVLYLALFFT